MFDTRPFGTAPSTCQFRIMAPARPHQLQAVDFVKHMFNMNEGPVTDPIDAFLFGPQTASALGAPAAQENTSRKEKQKPEETGKNQPNTKPTKPVRRWKGPRKR